MVGWQFLSQALPDLPRFRSPGVLGQAALTLTGATIPLHFLTLRLELSAGRRLLGEQRSLTRPLHSAAWLRVYSGLLRAGPHTGVAMIPGPDLVLSAAQTSILRVPLSSASPTGLGSEEDVLKRRPLGRSNSCGHRWNKP